MTRLEAADFCVAGADTLMVDFGTKTKMTRKNPFRKSRFAVIQGPMASELIARVSSLQDPIQWMTTAEVSAVLKTADPKLSAHSIKAGAAEVLEWQVALGSLDLELKSRLLKHEWGDGATETSQRYSRNRWAQALSLKTHLATTFRKTQEDASTTRD